MPSLQVQAWLEGPIVEARDTVEGWRGVMRDGEDWFAVEIWQLAAGGGWGEGRI